MTPERWAEIKAVFTGAVARDPEGRRGLWGPDAALMKSCLTPSGGCSCHTLAPAALLKPGPSMAWPPNSRRPAASEATWGGPYRLGMRI